MKYIPTFVLALLLVPFLSHAQSVPQTNCALNFSATPSTISIGQVQPEIFNINLSNPCGIEGTYIKMATGSTTSQVIIPSDKIQDSGTEASFTTQVTSPSTTGLWNVTFIVGNLYQFVSIPVVPAGDNLQTYIQSLANSYQSQKRLRENEFTVQSQELDSGRFIPTI